MGDDTGPDTGVSAASQPARVLVVDDEEIMLAMLVEHLRGQGYEVHGCYNGADAMKRISMVGNDLEINGMTGTCGKSGQSKAVGVGQPTVKFSELTVGGTG